MCKKYASLSEDRNIIDRQVNHLMELFVNESNCLEEISDTQIAATLIGLSPSLCTKKFTWSPVSQIYEYH